MRPSLVDSTRSWRIAPIKRQTPASRPIRSGLPALLALVPLVLAGCGGTTSPATTHAVAGNADPADVRVIDAWVTALRQGDVDAAAGYFAIPSVAENGPVLLHIRSL